MNRLAKWIMVLVVLAVTLIMIGNQGHVLPAAASDCLIEQENYTTESLPKDTMRFAVIGDFGAVGKSEQAVGEMVTRTCTYSCSWPTNSLPTPAVNEGYQFVNDGEEAKLRFTLRRECERLAELLQSC